MKLHKNNKSWFTLIENEPVERNIRDLNIAFIGRTMNQVNVGLKEFVNQNKELINKFSKWTLYLEDNTYIRGFDCTDKTKYRGHRFDQVIFCGELVGDEYLQNAIISELLPNLYGDIPKKFIVMEWK